MTSNYDAIRSLLDTLDAEQLATLAAILDGQFVEIPFASVKSLILALGGRGAADRSRGFWQIALSINNTKGSKASFFITPLKPFYAGEMFLKDLHYMLLSAGFRIDYLN